MIQHCYMFQSYLVLLDQLVPLDPLDLFHHLAPLDLFHHLAPLDLFHHLAPLDLAAQLILPIQLVH
jgi:hypothetical protein